MKNARPPRRSRRSSTASIVLTRSGSRREGALDLAALDPGLAQRGRGAGLAVGRLEHVDELLVGLLHAAQPVAGQHDVDVAGAQCRVRVAGRQLAHVHLGLERSGALAGGLGISAERSPTEPTVNVSGPSNPSSGGRTTTSAMIAIETPVLTRNERSRTRSVSSRRATSRTAVRLTRPPRGGTGR